MALQYMILIRTSEGLLKTPEDIKGRLYEGNLGSYFESVEAAAEAIDKEEGEVTLGNLEFLIFPVIQKYF